MTMSEHERNVVVPPVNAPHTQVRRHRVAVDRRRGATPRNTRRPGRTHRETSEPGTTAFVLPGGGSLTASQVGMLRALTEAGVRPDFVIGASAGALNAVMFAADPTLAGIDRLDEVWTAMRRRTVAPLSPVALARAASGHGSSLVTDRGLRDLLLANLTISALDQGVVPAHVVATDLASSEPVVLGTGPALDALLASSAFPGLYPPVTVEGRVLVDGGVSANTPVLQAEKLGASVCYVLPCATPTGRDDHRLGAMPLAYQALTQIVDLTSRRDLAAARSTVHVLPAPTSTAAHLVDFRDTGRLVARGHQLAQDRLGRLHLGVHGAGA